MKTWHLVSFLLVCCCRHLNFPNFFHHFSHFLRSGTLLELNNYKTLWRRVTTGLFYSKPLRQNWRHLSQWDRRERSVFNNDFIQQSKWKEHPWSGRKIKLTYWSTMTLLFQGWLWPWPVLIVSPWLHRCIVFRSPQAAVHPLKFAASFFRLPDNTQLDGDRMTYYPLCQKVGQMFDGHSQSHEGIAAELKRNRVCVEKVLLS